MENLNVVNGRTAMAYTGETPWHGKGTRVDNAMTSVEAIHEAGLDWKVEKIPVQYTVNGQLKTYPGRFVNTRMDTLDGLGVVGKNYQILQNKEAFSFFDAIVGEKLAMYQTAGALGVGDRIWLLAKLPDSLWITKDDKIEKYLLLHNSHNGGSSVDICATPIRVVCQNTLNVALTSGVRTKVRHTLSMGTGINEIREQIGIADAYYKRFEEVGKHLVSKQANSEIVEKLMAGLGLSLDVTKKSTRSANIRDNILVLFEKGKGNDMPSVKGTTWALFNGVTEYVDFKRSTKGGDRTESILFGSGASMKQKAVDILIEATK